MVNLQAELSYLQAHLATLELPSRPPPPPPPPPPPQTLTTHPPLSISDLPSVSSMSVTYDLSSLFDPMGQPSWAMQQREMDLHQYGDPFFSSTGGGGGDLQALARELFNRQGSLPPGSAPMHWCITFTIYLQMKIIECDVVNKNYLHRNSCL